jgi:hypothetical protein
LPRRRIYPNSYTYTNAYTNAYTYTYSDTYSDTDTNSYRTLPIWRGTFLRNSMYGFGCLY